MTKKKKIPCRVCGKLFEPCAYCQSHSDVFRWRNFACSRECATKYINETIAYRETLKNHKKDAVKKDETVIQEISVEKSSAARKKMNKKMQTSIADSECEAKNKETE